MKKSFKEFLYIILVGLFYITPLVLLYHDLPNFIIYNLSLQFSGLILFFLGTLIWIWGFFSLGKLFYILPKPIGFTKKGIYKYVSHPIYLGIVLVFLGLSISSGSLITLLYVLFILTPFNLIRIYLENKHLKNYK